MTVLILSLLAAHGAFAQKVTVEFDQAADFSKYKTIAIREGQLNTKRTEVTDFSICTARMLRFCFV
jgi:hypothetical protein